MPSLPTLPCFRIGELYSIDIRSTVFSQEYEETIFEMWRQNGAFLTDVRFIAKKLWSFLEYSSESDFEYPVNENEKIKIEMKILTPTGISFSKYEMKDRLYLLCDFVSPSNLRFILLKGKDLFAKYPQGTIPSSERENIFQNQEPIEDIHLNEKK